MNTPPPNAEKSMRSATPQPAAAPEASPPAQAVRLDAAPSLHPLAQRCLTLVGEEVPPVSMGRGPSHSRGDGHLIEVSEGAHATLRPDIIPPDGQPRHHVVNIRPSAEVELFIDDLTHTPPMSRSVEIWVGAGARLRLIDRACTRQSTVDLVGLRVATGAVVEFVGLRAGVSQSAVVAADLGPNARISCTWVHQAGRAESVDLRVRGSGAEARHTLMLSAPLGAGASAIRLDVLADEAGKPECQILHQGQPAQPSSAAWTAALQSIDLDPCAGSVELPVLPASLCSGL